MACGSPLDKGAMGRGLGHPYPYPCGSPLDKGAMGRTTPVMISYDEAGATERVRVG